MSGVRAGLIRLHRVLGVGLALFVMLWCGSGAVLLFVPYPNLTETERLEWLEPLQLNHCCISFESVWNELGAAQGVEQVRLLMAAGRPVYVIRFSDGTLKSLRADRGESVSELTQRQASRIAQQGVGLEGNNAAEMLWDDQWTVQQHFDPYRPLWNVQLHDGTGREVYVSSKTGEVVMETTAFERRWSWVGAVLHWLYVPALRRHWVVWDSTVWWLAAAGVVTAVTGLLLGLQHFWRRARYGHRVALSGVKRWHYQFGVVIGFMVCTWLLSGMLSMDHGRWFSVPDPTGEQRQRFMGGLLTPQDIAVPLADALRQVQLRDSLKEVLLTKVGGVSYYVFRSDPEHQVVVNATLVQAPQQEFRLPILTHAARAAFPAHRIERSELIHGDAYYYSTAHNPRPLPGLRIVLDDSAHTWLHIDIRTGEILERMDRSRRVYRWLFHGLHSWDIPFLLEHDSQRKTILLMLCGMGVIFSLSGVYLGIIVLIGRVSPKPPAPR